MEARHIQDESRPERNFAEICLQVLELTVSQTKCVHPHRKASTLLGWLSHTRTACGAKLLKANILQPLTHAETLALRYEALAELIEDENLSYEIMSLLQRLPKNLVCLPFLPLYLVTLWKEEKHAVK